MANFKSEFKLILQPIIFIIVIICIVGIIGYFTLGKIEEVTQGQVEVNEYRVSSKVPGRILKIYVSEGDYVHAGDTLVQLEAPDLEAKMTQAKALEAAASAQEAKAQAGTRKEQIQGALEMWKKAQAGVTVAEKTFQRVDKLFKEGVLPEQKLDEVTAQRDAAVATEQAAHAQYMMALNGAQREDKSAAAALASQAKGGVNEVESYLQELTLTASADGEVSEIFPKVGELVGTGAPILTVAQTEDMWVSFNVREDLLGDMKMGDTITAYLPALDKKSVQFKIYNIKDQGTYATWKATKSTGKYDLKTFEVKARPTQKIKDLRAGMSVILEK